MEMILEVGFTSIREYMEEMSYALVDTGPYKDLYQDTLSVSCRLPPPGAARQAIDAFQESFRLLARKCPF